jgi:TPR repeat protein
VKQRIKTFFAGGLLALTLFGVAAAGQFEGAYAADQRGDYATGMRLWRPLAEQGNVDAQFILGMMYFSGLGVAQDAVQAAAWLRKAADQGNADAQFILGEMYGTGQGVPQDYVFAHMWLNLAASRAVEQAYQATIRDLAVEARDLLATKMTPFQIAEAQRMAREWVPK